MQKRRYHNFLLKIFCFTVTKKTPRWNLLWSTKSGGLKNFTHKRGYQHLLSTTCCLPVAKTSAEKLFGASEIFRYRKTSCKRGEVGLSQLSFAFFSFQWRAINQPSLMTLMARLRSLEPVCERRLGRKSIIADTRCWVWSSRVILDQLVHHLRQCGN